jgi:hypothetical protein
MESKRLTMWQKLVFDSGDWSVVTFCALTRAKHNRIQKMLARNAARKQMGADKP